MSVVATIFAFQAAAATLPTSIAVDRRTYEQCVYSNAMAFERAKETTADTVAAAFSACDGERASILLSMSDPARVANGEPWDVDRAEDFIGKLIEQPLRGRLIVSIFKSRSR